MGCPIPDKYSERALKAYEKGEGKRVIVIGSAIKIVEMKVFGNG